MKRFLSCLMTLVLLLCAVGCGNIASENQPVIETILNETEAEIIETQPEVKFPIKGTVLVDRLNVRKEPDINCVVKYQLSIGEEIYIYEIKILDAIPWGRLSNDMWINLRYIKLEHYDFSVQFDYSLEDLHGLAIINFLEAGSDRCCDLCRKRICDVVLNRVEDYRENYFGNENTIKDVLTSRTQFSYLWKYYGFDPKKVNNMDEQHAIERAYMIAEQILLGNHSDVYQQGYLWYQGTNRTNDYFFCENCGICYSR